MSVEPGAGGQKYMVDAEDKMRYCKQLNRNYRRKVIIEVDGGINASTGKLAVDAIQMRDYPMIQAYVMWMAVIYVVVNLGADLLYFWLDPRVRMQEER